MTERLEEELDVSYSSVLLYNEEYFASAAW